MFGGEYWVVLKHRNDGEKEDKYVILIRNSNEKLQFAQICIISA